MVWLRAQRCCPGPLRQPHQGQSFQPHPSFAFSWFDSADQMATHWAWQLCRPNINPLGLNFARRAVTCRLRIRSGAGAGPAHPLLLAGSKVPKVSVPLLIAGSKVPKRHRLCRPNMHPLGLNPAGVLLFRMRAHAGPLRAFCGLGPRPKLPAPPILCF